MKDLRAVGVEVLTLGQYLRPSSWHLPVVEFATPVAFAAHEVAGRQLGFRYVASGPLVRSSYRAGELFMKGVLTRGPAVAAVTKGIDATGARHRGGEEAQGRPCQAAGRGRDAGSASSRSGPWSPPTARPIPER